MRTNKVLLTLLAAAVSAFSQTLPQGVEKKATVGGITEYDYSNGLRVLLFPDPSSPKVTVNMTYLVGSRFEGYGETGMAHLLEHMNFILTTDGRSIKKELTDHGAQWNGTTDYDRTNYFETVTASDENLKWALGLEADRMVKMRIEKPLLDTEMTVVRNEFERGENNPQEILEERVVATAYLWHNYGKSVIGSRADIEKVPIDKLAAFYRKYYQPDNAVLVIAGQFDQSKALAYVAETCGSIPRPTRKLDEPYTVEPAQDGERYVALRRVGENPAITIGWHAPALSQPDSAALEVLDGVLAGGGRGGTGRLYNALVDNKKALSVRMEYEELHDPGFVMVSANLSKDQSLEEARKAILDTIAGIATEPPTKEEVEKEKARILHSMELRMANSQSAALGLSEMIASGDWRLFFLNYDQIKSVTARRCGPSGEAVFQRIQPHGGRIYSHGRAGPHRSAHLVRSGSRFQRLQDRHGGFAGRSLRSRAGQYRETRHPLEALRWPEVGDAAQRQAAVELFRQRWSSTSAMRRRWQERTPSAA